MFEVTAEGVRTCPGCDKHWTLSYNVKWSPVSPPTDSYAGNQTAALGTLEPMKLWLDDIRPAPEGWQHTHSINEAIAMLTAGGVVCTHASLDHDLGDYEPDGGDGYKLVLWMAEHNRWPTEGIRVHSANVVGMRKMLGLIDRYGPYPEGWTKKRGEWSV